ncbi:hypothetical protein ACN27B_23920 [Micromonospora sp. WMMD754]|uniref:hypothetical protein n=1 Tax=Micromonospora sp. WMMD754 TaxID=3404114 RepID=UPI003BF4FA47
MSLGPLPRRRSAPAYPRPPRVVTGEPFPPIDAYAFLSDTHTTALVAPDGAAEWAERTGSVSA